MRLSIRVPGDSWRQRATSLRRRAGGRLLDARDWLAERTETQRAAVRPVTSVISTVAWVLAALLVLLAGLAGVGYGLAYRFGGLAAAIATHFGLNLLHFALFTYPMLAG